MKMTDKISCEEAGTQWQILKPKANRVKRLSEMPQMGETNNIIKLQSLGLDHWRCREVMK